MNRYVSVAAIATTLGYFASSTAFAQEFKELKDTFNLVPNPKFEQCLAKHRGVTPQATVQVTHGALHDELRIFLHGIKAGLTFSLFTVQRSNLDSNGNPDPTFTGSFGLAWYQTDLAIDQMGNGHTKIQTILIDEIFGFDADTGVALPQTNTFHVGFWFDDPNAAAPCGFDPTKPTPFSGNHIAGPNAMISLPNGTTDLGPLCLQPDKTTNPATCHTAPTRFLPLP